MATLPRYEIHGEAKFVNQTYLQSPIMSSSITPITAIKGGPDVICDRSPNGLIMSHRVYFAVIGVTLTADS